MTLTIDLKPETEARLQQAAQSKGLPLPDYAEEILERFAEADIPPQTLTPTEIDSLLDELAGGPAEPTQKETFTYTRADIYADHN
jgi:hypothetical protein